MSAMNDSYEVIGGFPVIEIGKLRHFIQIQKLGDAVPPTYNEAGPKQQFATFARAMAAIDMVSGTDVIKGGQTVTELNLTITMYYLPGITPDMQVLSDYGSTYVIRAVENVLEMNVVLVLNCVGLKANV